MGTLGEHQLLSFLDAVGLDDPHPAQHLAQSAGHLGVDLAPLAKQWTQLRKRRGHDEPKQDQDDQRHRRQPPVQVEQHAEPDRRGD